METSWKQDYLSADEMRKLYESEVQKKDPTDEEIAEHLFSDETVLRTVSAIIQQAVERCKIKKRDLVLCIESSDPRLWTLKHRNSIFSDDPRYKDFTYKVAQKLCDLGYTCEVYIGDEYDGTHINNLTISW